MKENNRIGFMQGRLSDMINNKIQSFPWLSWENEFFVARELGIHLMEWTLDQERLCENPIMTKEGQNKITSLCLENMISIPSLTGDCFMQAPFWKESKEKRIALLKDFENIVSACSSLGIKFVVIPLVDNGKIETKTQESILLHCLTEQIPLLKSKNVKVIFESDFNSRDLANFIDKFPKEHFGINYDIGNSASLGFDPVQEIESYGHRIFNVHVKDRLLGGTTVPLGEGCAKFDVVFNSLNKINYPGNFILQTARAKDSNHSEVLVNFYDMVKKWLDFKEE